MNLNKDAESGARVKPDAFLTGSIVQACNVIEMAVQDIAEQAAALDAKDAELEKWKKLAGQGIAIEYDLRKTELHQVALLAQAEKALKLIENHELRNHENYTAIQDIAREALAAIRASAEEAHT